MKRVATYLVGASAIALLLIISRFTGAITPMGPDLWQPDDSSSSGYIIEFDADSMITSRATGMPIEVITPQSIAAAIPETDSCSLALPRISTGSPMFDAAWHLAVSRLSAARPTPYNIAFASIVSPRLGADDIMSLFATASRQDAWPLADPERLTAIIAMSQYAFTSVDRSWLPAATIAATRELKSDSTRLYRNDIGLWIGGGDNLLSGPLPEWMTPADRFNVASIGVNVLAADAYFALASMQRLAGIDSSEAVGDAKKLATAVNDRLWLPVEGYYSQYLYGRLSYIQSPAGAGTGNALAASSHVISTPEMCRRIVAGLPRTAYGITTSFPLGSGYTELIAPEASQGIWAVACARASDDRALWSALCVLLRGVGLAASDPDSAESDIWAAYAGALARIIFGLEVTADGLRVAPVVPAELTADKTLTGLSYRNAILDITVTGTGSKVATMLLDGVEIPDLMIPADISGRHSVRVELIESSTAELPVPPISYPEILSSTPALAWSSPVSANDSVNALSGSYGVYANGIRLDDITPDESIDIYPLPGYTEWLVMPLSEAGRPAGYAAEPHAVISRGSAVMLQAEWYKARELARDVYRRMLRHWRRKMTLSKATEADRPNRRLTQIVELTSADELTFTVETPQEMECVIIAGYADGRDAGSRTIPLRSLSVNGKRVATLAMPRTGQPADTTVTLSASPVRAGLTRGLNRITLSSTDADIRPGYGSDTVMIDFIRIIPVD